MRKIIQIIPQTNNGPCGIEDYAAGLTRIWQERDGIEVSTLPLFVGGGRQQYEPADVIEEYRPTQVLIHFEAYGFARRKPVLQTVQDLLRAMPTGLLTSVFFHELFVRARPWQRHYLLSRRQRRAARMLAAHANVVATSNQTFQKQLATWPVSATRLLPMPVPSNIGTAETYPDWRRRQPEMVVFGGRAKRQLLYRQRTALIELCRTLNVERLIDIGPPLEQPVALPEDIQMRERGICAASQVQEHLLNARYGALALPAQWLAKSGIFAAYAAHGTLPVVLGGGQSGFDGLEAGTHFISERDLTLDMTQAAAVSRAAYEWYQPHGVQAHAEALLL